MIIRIVRMHFKPEGIPPFLDIFERHRERIRASKGCTHLELFRDVTDERVFVTVSYWHDEGSLEAYRNSELFKDVWGSVRRLFAEPSSAFSMHSLHPDSAQSY